MRLMNLTQWMQRWALRVLFLVGSVAWLSPFCAGETPATSASAPGYLRDIKPIFKARCFACHGAIQQKAQLRLDTVAAMFRGGDEGPAIVASQPDHSSLLQRISSTDMSTRMPPEGHPLTPEEIAKIRAWIESGAIVDPSLDHPEADPQDHWAFQRPVKVPVPLRPGGDSAANPIDAFILAQLDAASLAPRPLADEPTQLRRVTLDLIGVPPTPDELHAFQADESPDAYGKVVDRMLDDPRHGERWARHWMDVWRYADWHGRRYVPDNWNSAPQVWRWRDWIVKSLNEDHGYDRMVREMLAADELAADDPSAAVATGFLIRNWYALNPNDWMRANVEHTGKAFLGLTFNCAHCHDHKYDPITQDDYFRLRAFFEPINIRQDRVSGEADPGPFQEYSYGVLRKIQRLGAIQVFDMTPEATTWFYTGGDERNRVADRGSMPPALPTFLGGDSAKIEPVKLPLTSWNPGTRPEIVETLLSDQRAIIAASEQALATARPEVAAALPPLQVTLQTTEAEFVAAKSAAEASGQTGILQGQQSLLVNAGTGRRMITNSLTGLKTLETGTTISFQVRIIQEAHFNFQLAKDFSQGLTASFVGFEQGQIKAYQPGGFNEFTAAKYDLANGQNRFAVTLELDIPADRCLLTVRCLSDDKLLVDKTPIALNGWNPVGNSQKGVLLDGRPGSITVFDDLQIRSPASVAAEGATLVSFGFEPPTYADQMEVVGTEGWLSNTYCVPPATSQAVTTIGNDALLAASQKVHAARRAVAAHELRIAAAEARITAANAEVASIQARLAAEHARENAVPGVEALVKSASELSRSAALLKAQAEVLTHDQLVATAESKPATDATRATELDAASKLLITARESLTQATAAVADPGLATTFAPLGPTYPKTSTGRRRALAQWITARDNPLAARVAINHIWLRHFHTPIVRTVFDFGRNGADPTHPELLDWLAVELMENGWSMRHIHRLIVTSDAYRRVSSAGQRKGEPLVTSTRATAFSPEVSSVPRHPFEVDPENQLLWRMNTGRMEAEVVRDSLLAVAGKLDLTMGGQELENADALKTFRRTLYYSCQPELDGKSEFGALFDAPEPADCYRRTRSVIPQQSLALANSDLVHDLSMQIAKSEGERVGMGDETSDDTRFVSGCFERILGRSPSATELAVCLDSMNVPPQANGMPPSEDLRLRVRSSLVRVLLNHNDFITIR